MRLYFPCVALFAVFCEWNFSDSIPYALNVYLFCFLCVTDSRVESLFIEHFKQNYLDSCFALLTCSHCFDFIFTKYKDYRSLEYVAKSSFTWKGKDATSASIYFVLIVQYIMNLTFSALVIGLSYFLEKIDYIILKENMMEWVELSL